ncbi:uncharacterized protein LOC106094261 [Stomoxys calcitrans]|uniref:uncharacterized protein LOC106094261 n=1 Tax=Stomoxys calcitrans TaxID=35570 RepID=UPI0027E3AFD5|nr:uncharacterized protein LOC106094261 [Stomoxys calcitrans]
MQFLNITVLLAIAFVGSLATKPSYGNSEHLGKCVYLDLILSPGEHAKPATKCERFHCEEGLKGRVEPCDYSLIILEPPCWWSDELEDPNQPFPQCCMRKVICPPDWGN